MEVSRDAGVMVKLTTAEFARRVLIALALLGLAIVIARVIDVLLLLFAGCIVAIVLRSLASLLERLTPLRGSFALVTSALLLVLLLAGFVTLFGWRVARQLADLTQAVAHAWDHLRAALAATEPGRALLSRFLGPPAGGAAPLAGIKDAASGTFSALTDLLIVLFTALFLAADPRPYQRGLMQMLPEAFGRPVMELLAAVIDALRRWLGGVLVAMLCVGVITGVGLSLLQVPLAASLGVLAGLLEFVPYVGPIASSLPAILIAFATSPVLALEVVGLFLLVHGLEGYVLVPIIQRRAVSLPPALGLAAVFVCGKLFGPLGVVLAHPLTVSALVLVRKVYLDGKAAPAPSPSIRAADAP